MNNYQAVTGRSFVRYIMTDPQHRPIWFRSFIDFWTL